MHAFLEAISGVTGPLTLIAFLGVILLAIYRRSVKDQRGLEYVYNLLRDKLTREQFYGIAQDVIRRSFWAFIIVFLASLAAFVVDRLSGSVEGGQTVIHIEGTMVDTESGDTVVVNAPVTNLHISPRAATPGPQGQSGNVVVTVPSAEPEPPGPAAADSPREGDRIFVQGEGNLILTGGTENLVMTEGRGNVVIASRTGQPVKLANPSFDPGAPPSAQAIEIGQPGESTEPLREHHGLRPAPADDFEHRVGQLPNGLYGFSVSWIVGRQTTDNMPLIRGRMGTAKLELHKRPGGVVAVVGFVTSSDAALLDRASASSAAHVALYTSQWQDAAVPVSIPVVRIASVTYNGPKTAELRTAELDGMEREEDAMAAPGPEELEALETGANDLDPFNVPDVLELTVQ